MGEMGASCALLCPFMDDNSALYKTMLLIRHFEERLLSEFSTGKSVGTTHAYIGQEADASHLLCSFP